MRRKKQTTNTGRPGGYPRGDFSAGDFGGCLQRRGGHCAGAHPAEGHVRASASESKKKANWTCGNCAPFSPLFVGGGGARQKHSTFSETNVRRDLGKAWRKLLGKLAHPRGEGRTSGSGGSCQFVNQIPRREIILIFDRRFLGYCRPWIYQPTGALF